MATSRPAWQTDELSEEWVERELSPPAGPLDVVVEAEEEDTTGFLHKEVMEGEEGEEGKGEEGEDGRGEDGKGEDEREADAHEEVLGTVRDHGPEVVGTFGAVIGTQPDQNGGSYDEDGRGSIVYHSIVQTSQPSTSNPQEPITASSPSVAGTLIVLREDDPDTQIIKPQPAPWLAAALGVDPKDLVGGKGKKPVMKELFSPLKLEMMFKPPTPPSRGGQEDVEQAESHPQQNSSAQSFTFSAPRGSIKYRDLQHFSPPTDSGIDCDHEDDEKVPLPSSPSPPVETQQEELPKSSCEGSLCDGGEWYRETPCRPSAPSRNAGDGQPPTRSFKNSSAGQDSAAEVQGASKRNGSTPMTSGRQLRLFQYNYDTFTREHLSALVEEIDGLASRSSSAPLPGKGSPNGTNLEEKLGRYTSAESEGRETGEKSRTSSMGSVEPVWEPSSPPMELEEGIDRPSLMAPSAKRIRLSPREEYRGSDADDEVIQDPPLSAWRRRTRQRSGRGAARSSHRTQTPPSTKGASSSGASSASSRRFQTGVSSSLGSAGRPGPNASTPISCARNASAPAPRPPALPAITPRLSTSAPAVNVVTRDRLGEAKALMERLRAKASSQALEVSSSEADGMSSINETEDRKGEVVQVDERDAIPAAKLMEAESDSNVGDVSEIPDVPRPQNPTPLHARRAHRIPDLTLLATQFPPGIQESSEQDPPGESPRKILRKLSAAMQVEMELERANTGDLVGSSADPASNLPRFGEGASKPLRNALAPADLRPLPRSRHSSAENAVVGVGSGGPAAARRHVIAPPFQPVVQRRHFSRPGLSSAAGQNDAEPISQTLVPTLPEADHKDASSALTVPPPSNLTEKDERPSRRVISPAKGHRFTTIAPDEVAGIVGLGPIGQMHFDPEKGQWIKAPRRASVAAPKDAQPIPDANNFQHGRELGEEERHSSEEDPFKDIESFLASESSKAEASRIRKEVEAGKSDRTAGQPAGNEPSQADHVSMGLERLLEADGEQSDAEGNEASDQDAEEEERGAEEDEENLEAEEEEGSFGKDGEFTNQLSDEGEGEGEEGREFEEQSPYHLFKAIQHVAQQEDVDAPPTLTATVSPEGQGPRTDLPTSVLPDVLVNSVEPVAGKPSLPPIPSTPRAAPARPPLRPRSALKTHSDPLMSTPDHAAMDSARKRRSVSFSDGRKTGKIAGLHSPERTSPPARTGSGLKHQLHADEDDGQEDRENLPPPQAVGSSSSGSSDNTPNQSPSVVSRASTRTRRIDEALAKLNGTSGDRPEAVVPSSIFGAGAPGSRRFRARSSSARSANSSDDLLSRSTESAVNVRANGTFLTECSFAVSHDRLVKLITDVHPYEPSWETLRSIDLSNKGADSLVRMKEFLPMLDEANLSSNEISYLTGVPSAVRTLLIASNRQVLPTFRPTYRDADLNRTGLPARLTSLTSFAHLRNLERLDISNNNIDSIHQLSCLRHLRELKADNNGIQTLEGVTEIDGLIKLSLKGNNLTDVDVTATRWRRLEVLDLSRNHIKSFVGLNNLASVTMLNLDSNELETFESSVTMTKLRILRLCDNRFESLDVSSFPNLRTLFVDRARLECLENAGSLRKLENLSLRDQNGKAMSLPMKHVRDVRRLYLSGNPISPTFPEQRFFNLVYLELAMCQLFSLPANLSSAIPNVRVLNLNYNFIDNLGPLVGLSRLKRLTVLGARLGKCRHLADVVGSMKEIELLDVRLNPCTLGFYPPLLVSDDAPGPPHSEYQIIHPEDGTRTRAPRSAGCKSEANAAAAVGDEEGGNVPPTKGTRWRDADQKFRRALPDEWYARRTAYRASVLHVAPGLKVLDGLEVTKVERVKMRQFVVEFGPGSLGKGKGGGEAEVGGYGDGEV